MADKPLRAAILLFCLCLPLSIAGVNIAAGMWTIALGWTARRRALDWGDLRRPALLALVGYLLAGLLSSIFGVSPAESLRPFLKDLHKPWLLLLCFLTPRELRPKEALPALAMGFAAAALVGAGQSLFTRAGDGSVWVRAHGFVHPVTYGEQVALAWLGALCFWLHPNSDEKAGTERFLAGGLLAICSVAFLLNQTRGALLGLVAGFAAVSAMSNRLRCRLSWVAGTVVLVSVLWEILPTDRSLVRTVLQQGLEPLRNRQMDRVILWKVGLQIFSDHPWLGAGPGNYRTLFPDYFHGILANQRVWGSAHNLFVHQMAERGLLGLGALLAFWAALWSSALDLARREGGAWSLWAMAGIAAFFFMNFTEVAFQNEQASALVLFLWAWTQKENQAHA
ncbi:MAG: O-antigen ligase family protein [Elusimicrobia bacterium]|nr:O-antigen ligase family protein [Elusimicrobiota bacterium]